MKSVLLIVTTLSLFSFAGASADTLTPAISVACTAPEQSVSEFSFDLYATGHPMGGVTMFTGMFEMKSDIPCFRGHIITLPKDGKLEFKGTLNCASQYEVILDVDTGLFSKGVSYPSVISYRSILPLGNGAWTKQKMECTQQ